MAYSLIFLAQKISEFMWQGVRQNIFLGGGSANKKQLKVCVEYTFISEFMLRLHRGNFVNVK